MSNLFELRVILMIIGASQASPVHVTGSSVVSPFVQFTILFWMNSKDVLHRSRHVFYDWMWMEISYNGNSSLVFVVGWIESSLFHLRCYVEPGYSECTQHRSVYPKHLMLCNVKQLPDVLGFC